MLPKRSVKVLTMCRVGLSRSLALADVLKCHFPACDVLPIGLSANSVETLKHMIQWADIVILMREKFKDELLAKIGKFPGDTNLMVCEVGADVYGYAGQDRAILIDKVWRWARVNMPPLGITEGNKQ